MYVHVHTASISTVPSYIVRAQGPNLVLFQGLELELGGAVGLSWARFSGPAGTHKRSFWTKKDDFGWQTLSCLWMKSMGSRKLNWLEIDRKTPPKKNWNGDLKWINILELRLRMWVNVTSMSSCSCSWDGFWWLFFIYSDIRLTYFIFRNSHQSSRIRFHKIMTLIPFNQMKR